MLDYKALKTTVKAQYQPNTLANCYNKTKQLKHFDIIRNSTKLHSVEDCINTICNQNRNPQTL